MNIDNLYLTINLYEINSNISIDITKYKHNIIENDSLTNENIWYYISVKNEINIPELVDHINHSSNGYFNYNKLSFSVFLDFQISSTEILKNVGWIFTGIRLKAISDPKDFLHNYNLIIYKFSKLLFEYSYHFDFDEFDAACSILQYFKINKYQNVINSAPISVKILEVISKLKSSVLTPDDFDIILYIENLFLEQLNSKKFVLEFGINNIYLR